MHGQAFMPRFDGCWQRRFFADDDGDANDDDGDGDDDGRTLHTSIANDKLLVVSVVSVRFARAMPFCHQPIQFKCLWTLLIILQTAVGWNDEQEEKQMRSTLHAMNKWTRNAHNQVKCKYSGTNSSSTHDPFQCSVDRVVCGICHSFVWEWLLAAAAAVLIVHCCHCYSSPFRWVNERSVFRSPKQIAFGTAAHTGFVNNRMVEEIVLLVNTQMLSSSTQRQPSEWTLNS